MKKVVQICQSLAMKNKGFPLRVAKMANMATNLANSRQSLNWTLNDMAKRPFESGAWFWRKWGFWRKILKALPTSQIKRQRVLFESSDLGEKSVRPYLQVDWNGKEALWKWRFWRLEIEACVAVVSLSFTKWASTSRFSRLAQYTKETGTTATQAKGKRFVIFDPECFQGFDFHTPVTLN